MISSSINFFTTWSVSKFKAHNASVDRIVSVAFNTDTITMAVAFETTVRVSIVALSMCVAYMGPKPRTKRSRKEV